MKIYNGGNKKDQEIIYINGTATLYPIKTSGNQIYIELINEGNGIEEGFLASILFGNYVNYSW